MNRFRKCYLGSFLAGEAVWDLSGCLPTENAVASFPGSPLALFLFFVGVRGEPGNEAKNADYCMLVNVYAWLKSPLCLLRLKVQLGSVLESELREK